MAKTRARSSGFDATLLIQIALVLFLITLGIVGLARYNSRGAEAFRALNRFFGGTDNPVNLIAAIAELAAGIILGLALFVPIERRVIWVACIVIVILWIINILFAFIFNNAFEPDFWIWLNGLSADLIILAALWLVTKRYA